MLLGINLKNFAIIDNLSINFSKGLNIITGETGAGKSIIVDAINIVLGDKTTADLVKSGKEEAQIEALFDCKKNSALR
ncbi:MAG: AAA family ATPase, partial [Thermodesulfobacteriota bacterium]